MPFCYTPWSNIDIHPQGIISPCCKFRHGYYPDPPLNINQHGLADYEQSRTLQIVRQDFREGRWPAGCERCRIEEENGIQSKRQLDYDRWQEHYQLYNTDRGGLLTASVAFGNTCNLTCITCGPHASSRWQREHMHLLQQNIPPNHFYRQGFVDELLSMSPEIIHLDVGGGEPFLGGVPQQQELLQKLVDQGRAGQIALHYTTNVTIWPNETWWDLWQNFLEIDMQLSLDGMGDQFEYIRYPASWNTVADNVQKYLQKEKQRSNLRLSVSHTVSAYNIYYLPEFLFWCESQALPRPWLGLVFNPVHMHPTVWPDVAKQCIIDKLQAGNEDALTWAGLIANTDHSEHFELFRERVEWHDRYRDLDFRKTFPEMAKFL
jgi:sulfatase maturation enzyme AslB (radical SAM superfamily)